ncbi:chromate resistance protein ChrB domain-containing protein [Acuticoccus sp.]|uniref:chromate resistance protein ChrB domain-containing protein n=1 Tax=Acuticoccus sp. TaxID=1904378 RepID=UPI003B51B015
MSSPTAITVGQLGRLVGTPSAPHVLDVRIDEDVAADPHLIPGARLVPFADVARLADELAGQRIVVACQKGLKLSQGSAALLRTLGAPAEFLEGGTEAWRRSGAPAVPIAALPKPIHDATLWVTRHRPKIDRIACPWLVRRFVDRRARFLFVAPSEVDAVADRFGATPFDVEGAALSHRGDRCSFDTMVEAFGLGGEALHRLATVVRAADTNRHDLAPQAAGLLAVSVGLSRLHRDDLEQLEAGMALYDALYRWARDGHEEGHDWPTGRAA